MSPGKGGNIPDDLWEEGYSKLDWRDRAEIDDLADEKFGGNKIAAMKERFKGNIAMALAGEMPKTWQLYSQDELKKIQEEQANPGFQSSLRELLDGLEDFDPEAPLGEDEELKRWNK